MAPRRRVCRMIREYCGKPKLRLVDAMLIGNEELQELRKVNFPKEKEDIENLKAQLRKKMGKVTAEAPEVRNQQEIEA